jgi:hypothetical protein
MCKGARFVARHITLGNRQARSDPVCCLKGYHSRNTWAYGRRGSHNVAPFKSGRRGGTKSRFEERNGGPK